MLWLCEVGNNAYLPPTTLQHAHIAPFTRTWCGSCLVKVNTHGARVDLLDPCSCSLRLALATILEVKETLSDRVAVGYLPVIQHGDVLYSPALGSVTMSRDVTWSHQGGSRNIICRAWNNPRPSRDLLRMTAGQSRPSIRRSTKILSTDAICSLIVQYLPGP